MEKYPEINCKYQHYKGGKYQVITLAQHTETKEILVIYQSIHFGSFYARPLSSWDEKTSDDKDRFVRIEE